MDCSKENLLITADIWENIFEYFNLREQLHLTQVCRQFRNIIKYMTWKRSCKQFKLYPISANVVLVTNQVDNIERYNAHFHAMFMLGYNDCKITDVEPNKSSILLCYNEVRELLEMNLSNLTKLQIIEDLHKSTNKIGIFSFFKQKPFVQLSTLNLFAIKELNVDNLNRVNMCCPELKTLILCQCCSNDEEGVLQDRDRISAIAGMKKLETLIVKEENSYELNHILSMIRKLHHVSQLVFKFNIFADTSDTISEIPTLNSQQNVCQLLNVELINMTNEMSSLPAITKSLFNNFENLGTLALTSNNVPLLISQNILDPLLAQSCRHLKKLYLEYCYLENFIPVPSVETLTLINCCNLSWKQLKLILNQPNLKSFTSLFTRFSDDYINFYVESPLEILHIETIEYDFRVEFQKLLVHNKKRMENIKILIWHDYTMWYEEPNIIHVPLKDTYLNLQSLFIDLSVVALDNILEMKCLNHLALIENEYAVNFCHLLSILQHPTLETFTFYTRNLECNTKVPLINEISYYKTNLQLIHIPLDIFRKFQNIWLQMLSTNPNLKLICYFYDFRTIDCCSYLSDLISNDKFPVRIKSIGICDLTIDCSDIKDNPDTLKNMIMTAGQYCEQFTEAMFLKL